MQARALLLGRLQRRLGSAGTLLHQQLLKGLDLVEHVVCGDADPPYRGVILRAVLDSIAETVRKDLRCSSERTIRLEPGIEDLRHIGMAGKIVGDRSGVIVLDAYAECG